MFKHQKIRQVVKSPNGHYYLVVLTNHGTFFHRHLRHGTNPTGPWRKGVPPEWTSDRLQEIFHSLESQILKSP